MKKPLSACVVLLCLFGLFATHVHVNMQDNQQRPRQLVVADTAPNAVHTNDELVVADAAPNAVHTNEELRERAIEAVVATWDECTVLYFLHISKTGGTHFNSCIRALTEKDPAIRFKRTLGGLLEKPAAEVARWLGEGSFSEWLNCVKAVKSQGSGECSALQEPWSRHKVIVSTESSFKSFWSNVQQDDVKVGHELSNGTCFFSIVREPVSWMQSSYNHALRHGDLEWHMLHETNNFQTAYFEDIADVARRLTIFSTDRAEIVYEAMKRLLGLENVPEVCDVAFDGKSSNVRQSSSRGYDKSVEWSAWVRQYNGVDVRLFDALKGEYDGFLHIVAPEGQTVGSVQSAASFFDVVKDFQWEQPPPVETYRDYIRTH